MSEELKKYKVLKQLGWNKGVYAEGDTVEMEPRFAEYYINEKVLEESGTDAKSVGWNPPSDELRETLQLAEQPELALDPTTSTTPTPTTEPEAS